MIEVCSEVVAGNAKSGLFIDIETVDIFICEPGLLYEGLLSAQAHGIKTILAMQILPPPLLRDLYH